MDFKNRLKGSLTQSLFRSLLVDAGYHIVPLGIEEVIREVNSLPKSQYKDLDLPIVLRRMPDFFVVDKNYERHFLVEIKFRRNWSLDTKEKLKDNLYDQVKTWGRILLVVLLGKTARPDLDMESNGQFIGVIWVYLENEELFYEGNNYREKKPINQSWNHLDWRHFYRIQHFFPELIQKNKNVDQVKNMLKQLCDLDFFS